MADKMICAKCGGELTHGAKFCPNCGTPAAPPKPVCAKCGKELAPGTKFCPECGAAVAAVDYEKSIELDPGNKTARDNLNELLAESSVPFTPAEDFEYSETGNGKCICIRGCKNIRVKTINIPPEIDGKPVTEIYPQAFKPCKSLHSIILPKSLEEIGTSAFENCKALTTIKIPGNVTSIGYIAFAGCKSLEEIIFPPSLKTIGDQAFEDCESLTEISLPPSLEKLGNHAFSGCIALRTIRVLGDNGGFDTTAFINTNIQKGKEVNYREAEIIYSEEAKKRPRTWELIAEQCRRHGEYPEAIEAWDRAIALNPAASWYYKSRGDIWKNLQDYAKAIADYQKCQELDPDRSMDSAIRIASSMAEEGRPDIKDIEALRRKSMNHLKQDEYKSALIAINLAITLQPDFAQAWFNKGLIYAKLDESDRVLAAYSKAIELTPGEGQLPAEGQYYLFRSSIWYTREDYAKALADILRALQLNPNVGAYYYNLGGICAAMGDNAKAIVAYRKAVELGYEDARGNLEQLLAESDG
jgi:tetratricopeptide (TPR) repeat protein